jgi:hypothetical protein
MKTAKWTFLLLTAILLTGCAKMGQPDGGWYDETPPHVIGATPAEQSVNVKGKKIYINFDEFIKIDNATENVVVSPPQLEAPEIKGEGKRIVVSLQDSLKPNTTYTVDFSDAITDNNEGNPLGNYTYTFSTGNVIDTMEVSGYVVEAETLGACQGHSCGSIQQSVGFHLQETASFACFQDRQPWPFCNQRCGTRQLSRVCAEGC